MANAFRVVQVWADEPADLGVELHWADGPEGTATCSIHLYRGNEFTPARVIASTAPFRAAARPVPVEVRGSESRTVAAMASLANDVVLLNLSTPLAGVPQRVRATLPSAHAKLGFKRFTGQGVNAAAAFSVELGVEESGAQDARVSVQIYHDSFEPAKAMAWTGPFTWPTDTPKVDASLYTTAGAQAPVTLTLNGTLVKPKRLTLVAAVSLNGVPAQDALPFVFSGPAKQGTRREPAEAPTLAQRGARLRGSGPAGSHLLFELDVPGRNAPLIGRLYRHGIAPSSLVATIRPFAWPDGEKTVDCEAWLRDETTATVVLERDAANADIGALSAVTLSFEKAVDALPEARRGAIAFTMPGGSPPPPGGPRPAQQRGPAPPGELLANIASNARTLHLDLVALDAGDAPSDSLSNGLGDATTLIAAALDSAAMKIEVNQRIPPTLPGASSKGLWDLAQLHALAAEIERDPDLRRERHWSDAGWSALLAIVHQAPSQAPDILGFTLTAGRSLGRRAAAVFIDQLPSAEDRARTILHELGHVLNLVHPFEREVGRLDAQTCMNYGFIAKAAGVTKPLPVAFDEIELGHLRFGNPLDIAPGGTRFHAAPYWNDPLLATTAKAGSAPYQPFTPPEPTTDAPFALSLEPPAAGWTFGLGQPVLLEVRLNPQGEHARDARAPNWLLDAKSGQLEVQVRRPHSRERDKGVRSFIPIAQRCYAAAAVDDERWPRSRNLNLTYGVDGHTFYEPGVYEVRAVLRLVGATLGSTSLTREVVVSEWRTVRISAATSLASRDVDTLMSDDMGLYWALGGSSALPSVSAWLDDYVERVQGRARDLRDPIVAHALRCKGIDALRPYVGLQGRPVRAADPGAAARLLRAVRDARCLDAATLRDDGRVLEGLDQEPERDRPVVRGCPGVHAGESRTTARWNVLMYMAAEAPNLRAAVLDDLAEMQSLVDSDATGTSVRVLVQLDQGGPAGARRILVDGRGQHEQRPPNGGETNTGEAATLRDFVAWAARRHPAEHTLLVLWGHSQGVGFGIDAGVRFLASPGSADYGYDFSNADALTVLELGEALGRRKKPRPAERLVTELRATRQAIIDALKPQPPENRRLMNAVSMPGAPPRIDILGFDSCYMSAVEVACQLGSSVGRLLAATGSEPLAGWDYRALLREILSFPSIDPAALGQRLAEQCVTWRDEPALTLLNLDARGELIDRMQSLVDALGRAALDDAERWRILDVLRSAPSLGAREFLDLRELCRQLEAQTGDTTVQWAAARVARFLKPGPGRFVEALPPARPGRDVGGGVSLYCPLASGDGPTAFVDPALYAKLRFGRKTGWADFVQSRTLLQPEAGPALASGLNGNGDTGALAAQLGALLLSQANGNGNGYGGLAPLVQWLATLPLATNGTHVALPKALARESPPKPSGSDKSGPVKPSGDDKGGSLWRRA